MFAGNVIIITLLINQNYPNLNEMYRYNYDKKL